MQPDGETIESRTDGPTANELPEIALESSSAKHGNGASHFEYDLLHALQAMRVGDFSVRMAGDQDGMLGKIADTFNEIAAANQRIAARRSGARARRASASSSVCPMVPGVRWRIPSTP
jgi:hypothetical protein